MANGASELIVSSTTEDGDGSTNAVVENIGDGDIHTSNTSEEVEVISDIYATADRVLGNRNEGESLANGVAGNDPVGSEEYGGGDRVTQAEGKELSKQAKVDSENYTTGTSSKVSGYLAKKGKMRAENRAEQDKWLHAFLNAFKHTMPSARMSHFRYSADDLAVRAHVDKPVMPPLIRQNTMPDRMCNNAVGETGRKDTSTKSMVERIEAMGGQSYTPGQNAAVADHLKASKASPKLPKNQNLRKLLDKQISIGNTPKSDQESWIKEEEISTETVENDLYDHCEMVTIKDPHIYQEIPDIVSDNTILTEVMIENSNYADIDQNKNNVEYWEPIYALAKPANETPDVSFPSKDDEEDIPTPNEEKEENIDKKNWQKLAKMVKEERKTGAKRQSFVVRMFKKIKRQDSNIVKGDDKGNQKEEHLESQSIHDEDNIVLNEPGLVNDLSPEVLVELTEALHVMEKVDAITSRKEIIPEPEIERSNLSEELTAQSEPAPTQLEQLTQLQQPQLSLKQPNDNSSETLSKEVLGVSRKEETDDDKHEKVEEAEDTNVVTDFDYDIYDTSHRLNIPRPKLISKPKQPKRFRVAPDMPITAPRMKEFADDDEQVVPHSSDDNKLMTIDEILDDLENHNYQPFSRQKVKDLIEKFNETEHDNEEESREEKVIQAQLNRAQIEPVEELNSLLDELSKVANVLVASPHSTTCNENEPYSVEEWKNIIPIRKRRHSDPDYDIPRPHSALQIIPNNENEENKMQPTRFFGPVIIEHIQGETTSCGTSITPDSLEVDAHIYKNYTPSIEEDRSMRSYTSHVYTSNESHLNNNRFNNKLTVDDTKEEYPKMTLPPPPESEEGFYLNTESDDNNNETKLETLMKFDRKAAPFLNPTIADISNSVCFDSLEPFSDVSK